MRGAQESPGVNRGLPHVERAIALPVCFAGEAIPCLYHGVHSDLTDAGRAPAADAPVPQCGIGAGDPWQAALDVSLRKTFFLFGSGPIAADKLAADYACLYGASPPADEIKPDTPFRDVPRRVAILEILQHLASATLLFLFLLGLRNHFRIK